MGENRDIPGQLIYECTLRFTQVVEYGISANAVFSGQMQLPAEGARFDVNFEGPIAGPKLNGAARVWITFMYAPMAASSSTFTQRSLPKTERRLH